MYFCLAIHKLEVHRLLQQPITHFSVGTNTHACINPATALLLLPYWLQQHTRCHHRHATTCSWLVTAHSLAAAMFVQALQEIKTSTMSPVT